MKLLHIADLHIGKKLKEYSFIDDQKDILEKILQIIDETKPEALLISGDVYDRSLPSAEAVNLMNSFLDGLVQREQATFIISGNHDSPERIAYGGAAMKKSNIYVSPLYDGKVQPVTLYDEYGEVRFYLLPFIRPVLMRELTGDETIVTFNDALRTAIEAMEIDSSVRNVLLTHQFVTGGERSGSEEMSVGGSENVDAEVFSDFDYTALGHLHRRQSVSRENICYAGSPLKYSFAETSYKKSAVMVELGEKGSLSITDIPLIPLHDMAEWRGTFQEMIQMPPSDQLLHIILTDEKETPDAIGILQQRFPNLLQLEYDNRRTRAVSVPETASREESPMELFSQLYEKSNGCKMDDEQQALIEKLISKIWGDDECGH